MIRTLHSICALSIIINLCNSDNVANPSFDLTNSTINITEGGATETHRTTCKITTERLVANAQATFTRVLTGACNAKTIDERFEKLERSINKRLDELKGIILHGITKEWNLSAFNDDYPNKRIFSVDNDLSNVEENELRGGKINFSPRRDEVELYNNSIHEISTTLGQSRVYNYYWRVFDIDEKLSEWKTGRSERSLTFNVGNEGYAMYLRFTPKYFPDGTIFVSVGLTKGSRDSELIWPFPLQIRIEILDLETTNEPDDRSSRLWDPATVCSANFWGRPGTFGGSNNPECVGLSIPRQLLIGGFSSTFNKPSSINGKYVWNDSVLVKLTVHL